MAQRIVDEHIDFAQYMEDSDHAHKVRPASAFADDIVNHFHDPRGPLGNRMPWPKTHGIFRFRPAEVTLWSGLNGHGKSLVLGQVCLGLVAQRQRVCIASLEMRPKTTLARICRQASQEERPDPDFIREFVSITGKWLWLYDQQGSVRPDKMLAVLRYCADQIRVNHFVIDSLLKCGIGEDDYNGQKAFVDALTTIARDTGVHVHLVAHSRKGRDEFEAPGKMDVRGSGSISDQVDNVLTVWRNKRKERDLEDGKHDRTKEPDALLICDKQRNGEWEGRVGLWFDRASTQFVENGIDGPMNMLTADAQ